MKRIPERGTGIDVHATDVPSSVYDVIHSSGQPLDDGTRAYMEPRFGHDFSKVRIHADTRAAESAQAVNSLAYTVGNNMVFGSGRYAPDTVEGRRLLGHELTHTIQQNTSPVSSNQIISINSLHNGVSAGHIQCEEDTPALRARLAQVNARLAVLRGQERVLGGQYERSIVPEQREREMAERVDRHISRETWMARVNPGGQENPDSLYGNNICRIARASLSGNTATVSFSVQLSYLALPDDEARARAAVDIPRIESTIRDVWQVNITSGEYAGITFRVQPTVTFLPRGTARNTNTILIEVRGPDTDPSRGNGLTSTISLSSVHLDGARIIVVAHELAHLFGFYDEYVLTTRTTPSGATIEGSEMFRYNDPARRPDLLGIIDPVLLRRWLSQGGITPGVFARQTGVIRIWEEAASIILGTLGLTPPVRRPGPESEEFNPTEEFEQIRREGEARLSAARESRQRTEDMLQWGTTVMEIHRLEAEQRDLERRLGIPASP